MVCTILYFSIRSLNTHIINVIARSTPIRAAAGNLFDTTYGNGWYYFYEDSINTPETYGTCFVLKINNWSFRLAIGTSKTIYTNVNIGQGFGEWVKLVSPTQIPTMTFDNSWVIGYKVAGWGGIFAQIPLVSTIQKVTITKGEIFIGGVWKPLTLKRTIVYGGYHRIEFENNISELIDGSIYLCRVSGELQTNI